MKLRHSSVKLQQKEAMAWEVLRARRNSLIQETDKYLLPDYPIDADKLEEVKLYRQALRDLPSKTKKPSAAKWPVKPV